MQNQHNFSNRREQAITPGHYQFRPNPFVPWMNVRVFRDSITNESLRVRWAGVEIDAAKLVNHGEWKPV